VSENTVRSASRTGRSEIYEDIPDALLVQAAVDEEHLEILRGLQLRSVITVPLTARGRVFGVMTLVFAESGRRYGPADLALAEDLARRAALAVDNARIYQERDHIARTLQRSLLPPRLPDIPGISAVKIETATIACGSWNRMKAAE